MAERLAVNQEVRGSRPRRGAIQQSRVAQWQSAVLIRRGPVDRSHPRGPIHQRVGEPGQIRRVRGAKSGGSNPPTLTISIRSMRALGCGRSSMAELWNVTPPVPVRLRPVTPKRMPNMRRELERQSTELLPRTVRVRAPGGAPVSNPSWRNRQTHRFQKPGPQGMSVRLGPRGPSTHSERRASGRDSRGNGKENDHEIT